MAVNTTKITGFVNLPTGVDAARSKVIFKLSGFDTDNDDRAVVLPADVKVVTGLTGEIDVDLWPNSEGLRGTMYAVRFEVFNGNRPTQFDAGKIIVPDTGGPYDLNDLLPISPPSGASVDDYIAHLSASVAQASTYAAAADAASDRAQDWAESPLPPNGPDTMSARTAADIATIAALSVSDTASKLEKTPIVFSTRAEALAGSTGITNLLVVGDLEYRFDDSGAALNTGDGRKWSPDGDVSFSHFGTVASGEDAGPLIQVAMSWAMDNRRRLVDRGSYHILTPVLCAYSGFLDFDLIGAKFTAMTGWVTGTQMIRIAGTDPNNEGTFKWVGGKFNGEAMAPGSLNNNNMVDVSVANSATEVNISLEETYTGQNWLVGRADTHMLVNCSRANIHIGRARGAFDLAVYHTSSSNPNARRHEVVKITGTYEGCRRAVSTKRGTGVVDIDINVIDCWSGCQLKPADMTDGSTAPLAAHGGQVRVRATRTQHPVFDGRVKGIVYDVVATDMGCYFPADQAGGTEFMSQSARCEWRGATEVQGRIVVTGVNPAIVPTELGNFSAVWLGDDVTGGEPPISSKNNTFEVYAHGLGRLLHETGVDPDFNRIKFQSDIYNSIRVGANSRSEYMFSPRPSVIGSRDGNAALTSLLERLSAIGIITDITTP